MASALAAVDNAIELVVACQPQEADYRSAGRAEFTAALLGHRERVMALLRMRRDYRDMQAALGRREGA